MSIAPERRQLVFQKMDRALLQLSSGQQAERVHRFRTTNRRLQTLLEQVIPDRDHHQKKLLKMLDRIRKRAGKVRDLDVQLAALRSLKVPQEPRRKTLLMHRLIELRVKHEKKLRKLLNKKTIHEIRKRLKRASHEVKLESGGDALAAARTMVAQVVRPAGPVTEDLLHQYRIVVKRARYAAEFAPKSAESAQFIAQLKRLQDAIGTWHDWLTLTNTAAKRLGDVNQSPLVAALHNVTRSRFRQAVAALSTSPSIQISPGPVAVSEQDPKHSEKVSAKNSPKAKRIETAA
jgi:CHAD domain-containing protein